MHIVINPTYSSLASFIKSIPNRFEQEGESIYKARNEIKIYNVGEYNLNVKSYKVPILVNRIVYTFFRPTKAKRAYEYALKLLSMGVESPTPIAYIEEKSAGLLSHSYFISLHTPMQGTMRVFDDCISPEGEKLALAKAFAKFTAELHEKQVLHIDYSPGNILWEKNEDGQYHFSLIDINRMKFQAVDMETGCKNFRRLWAHDDFFKLLATEYAQYRGFDTEECIRLTFKYKSEDRISRKKREKRKAKIADWKTKIKSFI